MYDNRYAFNNICRWKYRYTNCYVKKITICDITVFGENFAGILSIHYYRTTDTGIRNIKCYFMCTKMIFTSSYSYLEYWNQLPYTGNYTKTSLRISITVTN